MAMPGFAELFAALLFGTFGFAAFLYGKKSTNWKPMVIGVALMVYPYFIENALLLYSIGIALCVSLFVFRD
ncbi:MAG TPA: hypothetical protein VKG67_01105 [Gallionellaceae bacterium]|nr:hypothetical protein [Gallionellaceae bacterium]